MKIQKQSVAGKSANVWSRQNLRNFCSKYIFKAQNMLRKWKKWGAIASQAVTTTSVVLPNIFSVFTVGTFVKHPCQLICISPKARRILQALLKLYSLLLHYLLLHLSTAARPQENYLNEALNRKPVACFGLSLCAMFEAFISRPSYSNPVFEPVTVTPIAEMTQYSGGFWRILGGPTMIGVFLYISSKC